MKFWTAISLICWAFYFGAYVGAKQELKRANRKLKNAHDVITSGTGRKHANGFTQSTVKDR